MVNHLQLMVYEGYLGQDPDMRYLENGTAVTNFSIGSTRQYKKGEEVKKETTWLKAVAWGKLAEVVNNICNKGSHVIITCQLRPGENGSPNVFETRSGGFGSSYEVTVNQIRVLDSKSENDSKDSANSPDEDEDLF